VTWLGLVAPSLIGGSVVIERIFALPGLGRRLFDAVFARDYPLVMGIGVVLLAASVAAAPPPTWRIRVVSRACGGREVRREPSVQGGSGDGVLPRGDGARCPSR